MALNINLRLLLISFYLIATVNIAFSKRHLSPAPQPGSSAFAPAPAPKRHKHRASVPSPAPSNQISFPPSSSSSIAHPPKSAAAPSISTHATAKFSAPDNKVVDLQLQNFCALTDHPDLCYISNLATLSKEKTITMEQVLESNMKFSYAYAKFGLMLTKEIAAKPGTTKEFLSALHECKSSYKDALFNMEKASSASAEHDIGTVQTMLSSVITDLGDCQDDFKDIPEGSKVADYAEQVIQLTSNSLALIERLTAAKLA